MEIIKSFFWGMTLPIRAIWKFMYMHPAITIIAGCLITSFIDFVKTDGASRNPMGFILIFILLSPFLCICRRKEMKKRQADYQAKKTAEELFKLQQQAKETKD